MATVDEVLARLDEYALGDGFPMLDNGYVYLAAARMSLHRSPSAWAMVIEVFGYSVRAGDPHLAVYTMTGSERETDFFHPIDSEDWTDADDVISGTTQVVLRGLPVELPAVQEYAAHRIDLEAPPQPSVMEVCRYLAAVHRDRVLATTEERRTRVRPDLRELLVLDEWRHPDLGEERPSDLESFWQLAMVLETGDVTLYQPSEPPNTHWRHWPEGGTL